MKKILLVDGNNLMFRAYYATAMSNNVLENSKGLKTNAIYTYLNLLTKIINEEKSEYVVVAFDKGKTFRHESYDGYKDGRKSTPEDLVMQIPEIHRLTRTMGISVQMKDNYEADDIIGTFSKELKKDSNNIITIVSADKDLLQLIDENVNVRLLKMKESIVFDKKRFEKEYGFEPIKMIDLKSLMGDASDNIPGVAGVGEKTALNLLHSYGSLAGVYEHIDNIKGKLQEKLIKDRSNAFKSYTLATIFCDINMPIDLEGIKYNGADKSEFLDLMKEYEFKKYSAVKFNDEDIKETYTIINDDFIIDEEASIYIINDNLKYHNSKLIGMSISTKNNNYYVDASNISKVKFNYPVSTYDIKKCKYLLNDNILYKDDLMLMLYLLSEEITEDIASYLELHFIKSLAIGSLFDKKNNLRVSENTLIEDAIIKSRKIYELVKIKSKELKDNNLDYLYYEIELPLINILYDMELEGIKVNQEYLEELGKEIDSKLNVLTEQIYNYAGEEFNIASSKQLGIILFEKMQLYYPKKSKSGNYSTASDVLDKIRMDHPIILLVEEFRSLSKLKSNYIDGLISEIVDGKLHTTFNQCLTRTGRLSSSDPNLQNIPTRDNYGKLIRKAFIASKDYLLSSDYSQVELRIFAALSGVDSIIDTFKRGEDIHTYTASEIFNKDISEVTTEERRSAKAVNFGIIYGISPYGLASDLGCSFKEAKDFIDTYYLKFSGIKKYMDQEIAKAKENFYVTTIMNRKRYIDELKSSNYMLRSQGERYALNTPIQGSSADILKKAMIDIFKEFSKRNLKTKMILQIHDELIFDVPSEELDEVQNLVKTIMENAYKLVVPLVVDIHYAKNLYDTK